MMLLGKKFGGLLVESTEVTSVSAAGNSSYGAWCRCECGKVVLVATTSLRQGKAYRCSKTCPVVPKRKSQRRNGEPRKFEHPLYHTWTSIRHRCSPGLGVLKDAYFNRGIRMCPEWAEDFWKFVADIGRRPAGTSIDRINNDGDYEPGNVRWATPKEQMANRREYARWATQEHKTELDEILEPPLEEELTNLTT